MAGARRSLVVDASKPAVLPRKIPFKEDAHLPHRSLALLRFRAALAVLLAAGTSFMTAAAGLAQHAAERPPQIVAYVFPRGRVLLPADIAAEKLTRINYAFANIQAGRIVEGGPEDGANLAVLVALKRRNPALQVLVSVGGWEWSGGFSDAAATPASRARFVASASDFVRLYGLDGLDLDWEYPGIHGATNHFRADDGAHFDLLLAALRERFDRDGRLLHRRLLLTIAAGASDNYLAHTDMGEAQRSLDTVNVMAYDYYAPSSNSTTGNHAPLFGDPADPHAVSADRSVQAFLHAGVPAAKLVLGVPFYGQLWGNVGPAHHGLFQAGSPVPGMAVHYGDIQALLRGGSFTRYWDGASSVPYLYSPSLRQFVSYEDPESLAAKCSYIRTHGLAGVMFWDYFSDPSRTLLDTLHRSLASGDSQYSSEDTP